MSYTEDSSDPEWKGAKHRTDRVIKQESNKPGSKPKYLQKFCDKWLSIFHPWLARCDDDANKPFCKACQCRLDCNRCHLQRHERTSKHARNLDILISKGEAAARENLSIRQERSKYYQQKKKLNESSLSMDNSMDAADEYIEETEGESEAQFDFVQTETAPPDHYTDEVVMKQEMISPDEHRPSKQHRTEVNRNAALKRNRMIAKKERVQLLMQIQKDKNDLMDSFKALMGSSNSMQSTPKTTNHVDLFFESVSSSVKALSPKLIAEAKMRVSQLIGELELRALTESDAAAGNTSIVNVSPDLENSYIVNQHETNAVSQQLRNDGQMESHS